LGVAVDRAEHVAKLVFGCGGELEAEFLFNGRLGAGSDGVFELGTATM
jgi:hypothetical protein